MIHVQVTQRQLSSATPTTARPIQLRGAYKTIAEALRQRIVQGEFAPGTMLPSEADMTSLYGVSRGTSRQAFLELQAMGLIDAVQGKGRFVKTSRNRDV